MTTFLTLLRRTAVALGAIAALTVTSEANAQAGTINLSNGGSCPYSSMTIDPSGAVNVTCDTGTPPPAGPGTFSIIGNVSSIGTSTANSGTAFQVRRVGGSAGEVTVTYAVAGACSDAGAGFVTFSSGSALSKSIPVQTTATPGVCTVEIVVGTPGISGNPLIKAIAVNEPVAGCPASDVVALNLLSSGTASPSKLLPSGVVASYRLPASSTNSGQFKLSETTTSFPRAPWYFEISISKCKGVIEDSPASRTTNEGCYIQSANPRLLVKTWMLNTSSRYGSSAAMDTAKICYTPGGGSTTVPATQDYYINIRYTYESCATGSMCGWVPQWTKYVY